MSDQEHRPMIFIKKFETEYRVDAKTGATKEVDWVEYSPIGGAQYLVVRARIKDLEPIPMQGKASSNPAVQMAHARWNLIEPKYTAWKQGQNAPVNGTPLAAWSGVSANQAELLRMNGVHSVEDVAALTDAHKTRIHITGLSNIIENAKRFLLAIDKSSVTKALEEKDAEIADLRAKMDELAEMVASQQIAAQPKRRGRPPKQPQPETEMTAA